MAKPNTLRLYLGDKLLRSAQDRSHNFLNQLLSVTEAAGLRTELCSRDQAPSKGLALYHEVRPQDADGLIFRRMYHGPFWTIENVNDRWASRVATAAFDPEEIDPNKAETFYNRWQRRVFRGAPGDTSQDGFVYVPLQDHLTERRADQMATPIEMIMAVLHHDPNRRVIVSLHPKVPLTLVDQSRLQHIQERFSNLRIQTGGMVDLLQRCDYVVTQNSAVAFNGYFFGKPSILFAKADFHHIALSVEQTGLASAFQKIHQMRPEYARYVYWFWQRNCINAGLAGAPAQIAADLRHFGWPV
jgi:hypothetical protein